MSKNYEKIINLKRKIIHMSIFDNYIDRNSALSDTEYIRWKQKSESVFEYIEGCMWEFQRELFRIVTIGRPIFEVPDGENRKDEFISRYIRMGFSYNKEYKGKDKVCFTSIGDTKEQEACVQYKCILYDGGTLSFWYYLISERCYYVTFLGKLMEKFWVAFSDFTSKMLMRYSGMENVPAPTEQYLSHVERWSFVNDVYDGAEFSLQEFIAQEIKIDLNLIRYLAEMTYEKRGSSGAGILFMHNTEKKLQSDSEFNRFCDVKFNMKNSREIRKLMEMSGVASDGKGNLLVVELSEDDQEEPSVVGTYNCTDIRDKILANHYRIHISCSGIWEMNYGDIRICYNKQSIYKAIVCTTEELIEQYREPLKISQSMTEIIKLLEKGCSHGAIVISFNDKELLDKETRRLTDVKHGYCMQEKLRKLNEENIGFFTSIDGAVFTDGDGYVYSTGVILDGMATKKGTTGRGSRFNSSRDYIYSLNNDDVYAVVISEDGGVDLVSCTNGIKVKQSQ